MFGKNWSQNDDIYTQILLLYITYYVLFAGFDGL